MHLLDEGLGALLCHLGSGPALLIGTVDDLVVDVGQVLGERHGVALVGQIAPDHVEAEERACIADMDLVVDRGAADIHADLARLDRLELLLLVHLAVIDKHLRFSSAGSRLLMHLGRGSCVSGYCRCGYSCVQGRSFSLPSSSTTAQASMPSSRPTKPRRSVVVAFTPTWSGETPRAEAIHRRISSL